MNLKLFLSLSLYLLLSLCPITNGGIIAYASPMDSSLSINLSADESIAEEMNHNKEINNKEQDSQQNAIKVALIGLGGVIIGGTISGLVSVFLVYLNAREAEKDRQFKSAESKKERILAEQRIIKERKAEIYIEFLQIVNKLSHMQREGVKSGKSEKEIYDLQKDLVEQLILTNSKIQVYGFKKTIESADRLYKLILALQADKDSFNEELNTFFSYARNDLQISKPLRRSARRKQSNG